MMEDVHCSSGDQLDSVDNLLFCSAVNSEPSIKGEVLSNVQEILAVHILYCYLNNLNCIYMYYGLEDFCLNNRN